MYSVKRGGAVGHGARDGLRAAGGTRRRRRDVHGDGGTSRDGRPPGTASAAPGLVGGLGKSVHGEDGSRGRRTGGRGGAGARGRAAGNGERDIKTHLTTGARDPPVHSAAVPLQTPPPPDGIPGRDRSRVYGRV